MNRATFNKTVHYTVYILLLKYCIALTTRAGYQIAHNPISLHNPSSALAGLKGYANSSLAALPAYTRMKTDLGARRPNWASQYYTLAPSLAFQLGSLYLNVTSSLPALLVILFKLTFLRHLCGTSVLSNVSPSPDSQALAVPVMSSAALARRAEMSNVSRSTPT